MVPSLIPSPLSWIFGAITVVLLARLAMERRVLEWNPLGRFLKRELRDTGDPGRDDWES